MAVIGYALGCDKRCTNFDVGSDAPSKGHPPPSHVGSQTLCHRFQDVTVAVLLEGAGAWHTPVIAGADDLIGYDPVEDAPPRGFGHFGILVEGDMPAGISEIEWGNVGHVSQHQELRAA